MKKMKFKSTIILVFAAILVTFVGCDEESVSSNDSSFIDEVEEETGNETIETWAYSGIPIEKTYVVGEDDYIIESSQEVVVRQVYISNIKDKLIAEVDYLKNSLNVEKVNFEIVRGDNMLEIRELSGLKRGIKVTKNTDNTLALQYFVDGALINRKKVEYTFADLFQIAKSSTTIGKPVTMNKVMLKTDGTFNSFSARCSTARDQVLAQIAEVGGYATTSGVDCFSVVFACWCSATVDIHGAGGSW